MNSIERIDGNNIEKANVIHDCDDQDSDKHKDHHHLHHIFHSWDDVVRAHHHDMWIDIPAVVRHLGRSELDNIMNTYTGQIER